MRRGTNVLNAENIRLVHGNIRTGHEAVRGVFLRVQRGELLGLLGPNGAGKTSLVSVLTGLRLPTSGRVLLDGQPLSANRSDLRARIGLAPQETALYGALTGMENMRFFGSLYGLHGESLELRATHILESLGLLPWAQRAASTYSGGMLRRLNLAVALVHDPEILFLDEPTVGVDPQSRALLFDRIKALHREGRTIIYTSHHLEEVEALCPRLAIMDHGQIIACEALNVLLAEQPGSVSATCAKVPDTLAQLLAEKTAGHWLNTDDGFVVECLDPAGKATMMVETLLAHGVRPERLVVRPADLQSVFLRLTGRGMRDG